MMAKRGALLSAVCVFTIATAVACERAEAIEAMPVGTEVTVVTEDGQMVRGKIARLDPAAVMLRGDRDEATTTVARTTITEVKRVPAGDDGSKATAAARVRTLTVPASTTLSAVLGTSLASDTSHAEDSVRATTSAPVVIDETTVIPTGSTLIGTVTRAQESGRVKGVAELGLRFDRLQVGSVTYDIGTRPLSYRAESTKKDDAVKIGVGAAAGAIVGAIAGGKKGAGIGTAVGAGGGTAVVLATDGDEIRLGAGHSVKVALTEPLTIRLR